MHHRAELACKLESAVHVSNSCMLDVICRGPGMQWLRREGGSLFESVIFSRNLGGIGLFGLVQSWPVGLSVYVGC